jgi:hypothetical protein
VPSRGTLQAGGTYVLQLRLKPRVGNSNGLLRNLLHLRTVDAPTILPSFFTVYFQKRGRKGALQHIAPPANSCHR